MRVGSVVFLQKFGGSGLPEKGLTNLNGSGASLAAVASAPAGLIEILGEPILHRVIESLQRSDVNPIFVIADEGLKAHEALRSLSRGRIHVLSSSSANFSARLETAVKRCKEFGAETVLLMEASAYVELDVADLVHEHLSNRRRATFVEDSDGVLPMAMVNSSDHEFASSIVEHKLMFPEASGRYQHRAYVNRLRTAHDLRRLATDALEHRCRIRPNGDEVAPGVWLSTTARIHSTARVLGPSYIGPNSRVRSGSTVGSCSTVERDCIVERGSVVNDSSILAGTYVGACLDLCHAVVDQNHFVDLQRNVGVHILDSLIGRTTLHSPQSGAFASRHAIRAVGGRLRDLLTRREVPGGSAARVSYSAPERWTSLKPISGTTDSTVI
jgi:NDP-sugar pyrophosphorylase family protein